MLYLFPDPYAFDITIEQGKIDIQTATIYYSGVPEPEEKYVNIYRAIYLLENDKIDDQSFKIPKVSIFKLNQTKCFSFVDNLFSM